jgi:hypothetical protein
VTYPVVGPGYIDADDALLTCQQMADLWLRYEQAAPEDREGPLALVVFDESTKCGIRPDSTSRYSSNILAESTLVAFTARRASVMKPLRMSGSRSL